MYIYFLHCHQSHMAMSHVWELIQIINCTCIICIKQSVIITSSVFITHFAQLHHCKWGQRGGRGSCQTGNILYTDIKKKLHSNLMNTPCPCLPLKRQLLQGSVGVFTALPVGGQSWTKTVVQALLDMRGCQLVGCHFSWNHRPAKSSKTFLVVPCT